MNDDLDDLAAWKRALRALDAPQRAMVLRMARMLCAAADAPSPRRTALALAPAANNDGDPPDELARAAARSILAQHRRSTRSAS